jgi:dTMP kinase
VTFLLELPLDEAAARAGEPDRFEAEGLGLQERVRDAYERLAAENPDRWRRIDAARPADEVHADARRGVPA